MTLPFMNSFAAHLPPLAATALKPRWRLYAFEITRRTSGAAVPVAPRRVLVYATGEEEARAGLGISRDEASRPTSVRAWEGGGVRRPSREDLADFFEALGHALATGAGMTLALTMAARMARSPMMRGVIGSLLMQVSRGQELHAALRAFPRVFSPMQLAMVEASSAAGLDQAGALLVQLATRLQREGRLWRKFIHALTYPVSLLALTLAGSIILEIWALPPMVELFRTLGGTLPPVTQAFYDAAQFMRVHGVPLVATGGLGAIALVTTLPRIARLRAVQRFSTRVSVVGPIVQWLALVRALGTFVMLKQSGAKVRDQFFMAASAAGNCVVGEFFTACYERIAAGETVEEAFSAERHRLGDDGVRIAGKMEIGMAGGNLGVLLSSITDELNERAEMRLALLPNLLRWPLLIVCCAMIGTIALAIVLPYPNLIADVASQQANLGK